MKLKTLLDTHFNLKNDLGVESYCGGVARGALAYTAFAL